MGSTLESGRRGIEVNSPGLSLAGDVRVPKGGLLGQCPVLVDSTMLRCVQQHVCGEKMMGQGQVQVPVGRNVHAAVYQIWVSGGVWTGVTNLTDLAPLIHIEHFLNG